MRKSIHKILRITVLLLVILMTCTAFLIHSFAADSDPASDTYINTALTNIWNEFAQYADPETGENTPFSDKIKGQVGKYHTKLSDLTTSGTVTVTIGMVDLIEAKAMAASEIAYIYYSSLDDLTQEDTTSDLYKAHIAIQNHIADDEKIPSKEILDSVKNAAVSANDTYDDSYDGGYLATIYREIYLQRFDELYNNGESKSAEVQSRITTGIERICNLSEGLTAYSHTDAQKYQEIYDIAKTDVILQRNRDTAKTELTEIHGKIYPRPNVEESAFLTTALDKIQLSNNIGEINQEISTDIIKWLSDISTPSKGEKSDAYIADLKQNAATEITSAGSERIASVSKFFATFDPDYYREVAKDKIETLFTPNSDDIDNIAGGIIAEYNSTDDILDKCEDTYDIDFEMARAEKRKELYDYYFDALDSIEACGQGDVYSTLAESASDAYKTADEAMMGVDRDAEGAKAAYEQAYTDGTGALDGVVDEAQAQRYIDGHVGAISAATATKDDIKQAVEDAELLDADVKALLGDTFESLAKNYKDIVKGEIIDTVGEGKLSQDVEDLSISANPSNVDKLKALVADADRALDKAEQIKRVNDRYDDVADAGTKQDLSPVKDTAVQKIQDADDAADIERIADQAILEISQTEAIDRINAAVDSEKYGELADNTVTAATDDINSYTLDNITDIDTAVADIAKTADDTVFAIQKIYAKDDAQNDADALKDKIDGMVADGNMTQEQANALKNDITDALSDALTDGEKNIDNVANVTELGEVVRDFNTALDTVEEEATLKSEAVEEVKKELAEVKEHINALGSVSNDAKADYAGDADDVLSALHTALFETDTEDGIKAAEQSAIEALDKIKTDSAYVNNAQEEIYEKRDELLDEINDHSYLDDDTKADMIADVNEAVSAAETAIAGTDDHGAIDTAKQTALDTLNGISQSGTAANNSAKESQLADATDALNDKATAVKGHIDSLTYITDEEKAELKADADKALADALDELSSVNSTGDINKIVSDGVEALDKAKSDADKQNGAAKDTQTALADSELDSKRNETVAKIDGLYHLTDEEKNALKKELDDTLADAKSAVDGAASTEAITAAKADGIADIQKIADSAETKNLENVKSSAIDELEAKTEELIATIDAFKYLEDEEKAALKKELEGKLSDAADKINEAESVNDVADIKTAALSELDEYNKKALADEDEALVDKLLPIMITLGVLLVAEAIALAVLLIKRPKATGMAAFAPIGIGALKLQPTGAWTLTGVLAAADVILAALIVWLVIERIRASKAAAVEAPAPEPEAAPEPEPEPEEEPVQIETVESITVEEAEQMMTDEEARQCEETDFVDTEVYTGAKKAEINIDVISRNFEAGDTVTLNSLKAKGLVPKQAGYVKVLARGTLDKPLTVIAQSFSMAAVKMIVLTGGTTILTHSSPERQ